MQVSNNFNSSNMLKELLNAKQEVSENSVTQSTPTTNTITKPIDEPLPNTPETLPERQTYGLLVLELMSDPEYKAFERATAGMSEGEKIVAAQSLYSLTSFYGGKLHQKSQKDGYSDTLGIQNKNFIERYKNAFASQEKIDISS
ncbi:hypothetical protein [Helicobacter anatolicus]|uniref:hypothetical protein n=1 Tax=Helicobacter anatolicus TaxID=2905874 RepID=UPI001E2E7E71|nr:hypothetical protein [Helicobacter anatolicus]MCE3038771.1 hypothetical protein [Helicobacter anatolicus]MCE3039732.1 hypothetical protein [Helicobacter anatolicus]